MIKNKGGVKNDAPTIDQIDADNTPSLVGFWKCDDNSGLTVKDYSGNGHDLTIEADLTPWASGFNPELQPTDVSEVWSHRKGYLSIIDGINALIDATGTPLTHGSKTILLACEIIAEHKSLTQPVTAWFDCDLGSAWNFPQYDYAYTGFMIGTAPPVTDAAFARATQDLGSSDYAWVIPKVGHAVNAVFPMAGGFVAGDHACHCIDGSDFNSVSAVGQPTVANQGGKFGLGSSSSREFVCIRNFQAWVFDTEPPQFDMTVEWLGHNGGKIPPWWIGR